MKNKPQNGDALRTKWRRFIYSRFKNNEIKLHELRLIFWESTRRCNLECLHCGSDCNADNSTPDPVFEDFLKAILPVKAAYPNTAISVAITGGEPLLRNDLADCGRALFKNGFGWGIVTNGYAYTCEIHTQLLDAGMGAVTVSIDGLEESHNWLRGSADSFRRAMEAVRIIASTKEQLNFDIITCVNSRNLEELDRLRDLFVSVGVPAWRLYTIAPIGRARNNRALRLSPDEIKRLLDFIALSRGNYADSIDINFGCEAYTGPYEEKIRPYGFFCRAGINIASVLVDGSIAACPNISRDFNQGSIYNDSFVETWYTRYVPFRYRRWTRRVGPCSVCKDYRYCLGGAMHLWNGKNGELLSCINCRIDKSRI
jgi:radical SAM enzyme (rSAM/lipoprotein system)